MSYAQCLASLSGNDKNNLQACLDKLDKRQNPSSSEAKNCSLAIGKLNKVITDKPLIDHFIKLLSMAFQLNSQETDVLKRLMQSSRTMSALTNDTEYLTIIKIAKNLQNYHQRFRPMPNLNSFFNLLHSDKAFESIIGIIKSANLSDALAIELLKAQYKSSYSPSSRTDELNKAIIKVDKLSILPDKAFHNLTTHLGKKFSFTTDNIKILQQLEKNGNKNLAETLYNAFKDKSNIQYMPKITRELLQNINKAAKKEGMEDYFKAIANIPLSQFVKAQLTDYQTLLIKIEQGAKPTNDELKKLDLLHDELKRHNKLDAMPNRSQAYLENYQLEQDLKKKAPLNAQKLLEKLKNNQTLTVFQAFYLTAYLNEKRSKSANSNVPEIHASITHILQKLPQDVRNKAAELGELKNPKLLEVIDNVVEQIRAEEKRLSNRQFFVKEYGVYLKITSNYMEPRIDRDDKDVMLEIIKNANKKSAGEIAKAIDQDIQFRYHEAADFTASGLKTDPTLYYIKDTQVNPTISIVLHVADTITSGRATKDITILEYNENSDKMVLTTFRHTQLSVEGLPLAIGTPIKNRTAIGTAMINENKNEHTHIEKRTINVAKMKDWIENNIKKDFKTAIRNNGESIVNEINATENKNPNFSQLREGISQNDDQYAIALFTPSSNLGKKIMQQAEKDWKERANRIIQEKNVTTIDIEKANQIYKQINKPIYRDLSTLNTIITILLKMKIMLEQVGEKTDFLTKIIHKTQKTILDLEDLARPRPVK